MGGGPALISRLKALIAFRALFVTLLLGSSLLFRLDYARVPHQGAVSFFIVFLYVLTIAYSLLLNRLRNSFAFAYVQLILDVLCGIGLVFITGGIESWFSFVLVLVVLSSAIILNRKAGFVTASLSAILYGVLLDLQYYRVLPISFDATLTEKQFFYNIFIHTVSLFVTAYLGGHLSSRLERTVKKLEEKDSHLKDLELFNVRVIESLPSGLFTTDTSGSILVFNRAAEKITGLMRDEIIGRHVNGALPFVGFPFRQGRHEIVLGGGREDAKIIGITITALEDSVGRETGYIGVFQDLTQLKKLETEMKQREKWAVIGELSANIAHEIRNPIASLRSSIEMLREGKIPGRHREKLMDIAINETERLNNIITDFLTYSRPRPIEVKHIDLHGLLANTLDLLRNLAETKNTVSIRKDFRGPLFLDVDPEKIRQVFWNLGLNAIEAMPEGGELRVSTGIDGDSVIVSFSDTGSGISRQDIEKIFYPFFTTKEHGTGLGLSIAYRIVEEHGGRLTAKSTPGIGTTFEIILLGK